MSRRRTTGVPRLHLVFRLGTPDGEIIILDYGRRPGSDERRRWRVLPACSLGTCLPIVVRTEEQSRHISNAW